MTTRVPAALMLRESSILSTGSVLLGQSLLGGRPLLMAEDDITRHTLVVGTTGSGKTELLLGMSESTMLSGGGMVFVDGKGDLGTWARVHAMAQSAGRGEDLMLVNLGPGATCTWNPLAHISPEEASTLLIASMPAYHDDMWQQRAASLMRTACFLAWAEAEIQGVVVEPTLLRDCLMSEHLIEALSSTSLSPKVRTSVTAYLNSVPGYAEAKGTKQGSTFIDQHGYLSMQWTASMGLLCDTYGHVFREPSVVDMDDVLRNRRILYVTLPSMTRSASDMSLLGGLVFSALRTAMLRLMPQQSTGAWDEVANGGQPRGLPSVLCFLDEVGHYLVSGMGVLAAQARSLGVGLVFATQDMESMQMSNLRETCLIAANVGTRVMMRQVNPDAPMVSGMLPSSQGGADRRTHDVIRHASKMVALGHAKAAEAEIRLAEMTGNRSEALRLLSDVVLPLQNLELKDARTSLEDMRENPEWSLVDVVRNLGMGEFVAVQGGQFVIGRAIHASAGIKESSVSLPSMQAVGHVMVAQDASDLPCTPNGNDALVHADMDWVSVLLAAPCPLDVAAHPVPPPLVALPTFEELLP